MSLNKKISKQKLIIIFLIILSFSALGTAIYFNQEKNTQKSEELNQKNLSLFNLAQDKYREAEGAFIYKDYEKAQKLIVETKTQIEKLEQELETQIKTKEAKNSQTIDLDRIEELKNKIKDLKNKLETLEQNLKIELKDEK